MYYAYICMYVIYMYNYMYNISYNVGSNSNFTAGKSFDVYFKLIGEDMAGNIQPDTKWANIEEETKLFTTQNTTEDEISTKSA